MSEFTQPNPAEIPKTPGDVYADAVAATQNIVVDSMLYETRSTGRLLARNVTPLSQLNAFESSIHLPRRENAVDQSLVAVIQTGNGETLGVIRAQADIDGSEQEGYILARMPTERSQLNSSNRTESPDAKPQVIARLFPGRAIHLAGGDGNPHAQGNPVTNICIQEGEQGAELLVADVDPRPGLSARVLTKPSSRRETDIHFRNASRIWRPGEETVLSILTQQEPTADSRSFYIALQRQDILGLPDSPAVREDTLTSSPAEKFGILETKDVQPKLGTLAVGAATERVEGWSPVAMDESVLGRHVTPIDIVDVKRRIREPFLERLAQRVRDEGLVVTDEHLDVIEREVNTILGIRNVLMGNTVEMVAVEPDAIEPIPSASMKVTESQAENTNDRQESAEPDNPMGVEESHGTHNSDQAELLNDGAVPPTVETDRAQVEEQKRLRNNTVIARAIAGVPQDRLTKTVQVVLGAVKQAQLEGNEKITGETYPQLLAAVTQIVRSGNGEKLDIEAKTAARISGRLHELTGDKPIPNEVWGATSGNSMLGRMRLHADTILRDTVLEIVKKKMAE